MIKKYWSVIAIIISIILSWIMYAYVGVGKDGKILVFTRKLRPVRITAPGTRTAPAKKPMPDVPSFGTHQWGPGTRLPERFGSKPQPARPASKDGFVKPAYIDPNHSRK